MMKWLRIVHLCRLTLVLGIVGGLAFGVAASFAEAKILYQEGFEDAQYKVGDELPESWEPTGEAGEKRHVIVGKQTQDAKIHSGQKAVLLDTTAAGGGNVIRYQKFPPSESDIVSFQIWVYTTPDGPRGGTYYCSDDPDNAQSAVYIAHHAGGKLSHYKGGWIELGNYGYDKWVHVGIEMDIASQTFSVWISDDQEFAATPDIEDIPFRAQVSQISIFALNSYKSTGYSFVDDILVYEGELGSATPSLVGLAGKLTTTWAELKW